MTEPFKFNRAEHAGTTVIARKFHLTNAQANGFKNSDAMKTILKIYIANLERQKALM